MSSGIVLRRENHAAADRARSLGIALQAQADRAMAWPRTLFASAAVPWDMVAVGFRLLDRWEVAAPLVRGHVLAADLGSPAERERTQAVMLDLRVPVYSPDLVLVRDSEHGRAFLEAWEAEADGGEERLAFLRALCRVKPLFLALPSTWLTDEAEREKADPRFHVTVPAYRRPHPLIMRGTVVVPRRVGR